MKKEKGKGTGRIEEIKRKISDMDLICAGTLQKRMKTCGRPYCRCLTDPEAMHGPYYEWTRYVNGRLVHRTLSLEQVQMLEQAIANNRELKALLDDWRHESAEIILEAKKAKC